MGADVGAVGARVGTDPAGAGVGVGALSVAGDPVSTTNPIPNANNTAMMAEIIFFIVLNCSLCNLHESSHII